MKHDPKEVWREAKRLYKKWGDWGFKTQLHHLHRVFPHLSDKNVYKAFMAAQYASKSPDRLKWRGTQFTIELRRLVALRGERLTPRRQKKLIKERILDIWDFED